MVESTTNCIEKQVTLNAPVSKVWRALTDYKEFGQWFGVNLKLPFEVGKSTHGNITYPGYEHLVMDVLVKQMELEKVFSFEWHPYAIDPEVDYSDEPPTLVEFRLTSDNELTTVVVTECGFDAIPASRRDEAFRMNEGGWTEQMKNIERYVTDTAKAGG